MFRVKFAGNTMQNSCLWMFFSSKTANPYKGIFWKPLVTHIHVYTFWTWDPHRPHHLAAGCTQIHTHAFQIKLQLLWCREQTNMSLYFRKKNDLAISLWKPEINKIPYTCRLLKNALIENYIIMPIFCKNYFQEISGSWFRGKKVKMTDINYKHVTLVLAECNIASNFVTKITYPKWNDQVFFSHSLHTTPNEDWKMRSLKWYLTTWTSYRKFVLGYIH